MDSSTALPFVVDDDDDPGSPTQVNEGRSYEQYEDPAALPAMPATQGPNAFLNDDNDNVDDGDDVLARSLGQNDTGAVNFDSLTSGGLDFESPVAQDAARRNGPSHYFLSANQNNNGDDDQQQNQQAAAHAPLIMGPETPGPPKNPFAGKFQTPLLPGSQLFAQTPFSAAAAFRQASPTSSRPSPSDLPMQGQQEDDDEDKTAHAGITSSSSPLKHRFLPLSPNNPVVEDTPARIAHILSTSSSSQPQPQPHFDTAATTPYLGGGSARPAATTTDSSSPMRPIKRGRPAPRPIAEYEPMRQSQERRRTAAALSRAGTGDGLSLHSASTSEDDDDVDDDDDGLASQRRRRLVQQKKEEGAKMLSTISMARRSLREDVVEVPASTKKGRAQPRSRSRQQHHQQQQQQQQQQQTSSPSRLLDVCPESDPQMTTAAAAAATGPASATKASPDDAPESEVYEGGSFTASMLEAYTAKTLPDTKTTPSSSAAASLPCIASTAEKPKGTMPPTRSSYHDSDAIPETSPVGRRPVSGWQDGPSPTDPLASSSGIESENVMATPDDVPQQRQQQQHQQSPPPKKPSPTLSALSQRHGPGRLPVAAQSSAGQETFREYNADTLTASSPVLSVPPPGPAFSAGPNGSQAADDDEMHVDKDRRSLLAASVSSSAGTSASDLSSLSATPSPPSREGTPITVNDSDLSVQGSEKRPVATLAEGRHSSPHRVQSHPRETAPIVPKPPTRVYGTKAKAAAVVGTREQALAGCAGSVREASPGPASASTLSLEKSVRSGRRSARGSATAKQPTSLSASTSRRSPAASKVFAGMLFAISFQSKHQGETVKEFHHRTEQAELLKQRIQEAGGRVLSDDFDELFNVPPVMTTAAAAAAHGDAVRDGDELQLRPEAAAVGFTALIADGHSRKVKYIQALALGLPCVAVRWAVTCLDRHALVDWAPYLLCAGPSSYLGDAIRSRSLAPYDARTARLADVVRQPTTGCTPTATPTRATGSTPRARRRRRRRAAPPPGAKSANAPARPSRAAVATAAAAAATTALWGLWG
ncbi:brct domain containing protein [Niveomyces insectorum RCEF 264]|uniref:Brct domain containing protein n=1 Tax=Niveomyces insectorum RCEF 264 TaxID=1081102 RepID=A0A167X200_9HYPO|nr:brct domain containing protein [Niveomyces insectorum RCEF 264]